MTSWLHLQINAPDFSTPITSYGWSAAVKAPELTDQQREFLDELEVEVEFGYSGTETDEQYRRRIIEKVPKGAVYTAEEVGTSCGYQLDQIGFVFGLQRILGQKIAPINLLPTQVHIDPASLARLDEAEDLPHIIVLLSNGKHYIHDGHHRATRAMLRGELIDAVVVNLEMIK